MSRGEAVPRRVHKSGRQIFAVPTAIAILSTVGLVAALTGDGWRNLISWIGLAVPVGAALWAWRRKL